MIDDLDDINMERLNRDLRHALDFESLDQGRGVNLDQRLIERAKASQESRSVRCRSLFSTTII